MFEFQLILRHLFQIFYVLNNLILGFNLCESYSTLPLALLITELVVFLKTKTNNELSASIFISIGSFMFSYNYLLLINSTPYIQKRLAKEAQAQELQAKNSSLGKKMKEPAAPKTMKGRGGAAFYRVTCKV